MTFVETETFDLSKLNPILEKYRSEGRTQLLPALWAAQDIYGYLSEPVVIAICNALGVPFSEAYGVIEFYTMFYKEPVGRTIVRVCTGPMCTQMGAKETLDAICGYLQVEPGETTEDGRYTVEAVECLGLCDHAPAALVGETPVAKFDIEKFSHGALEDIPPAPLGVIGGEHRWLTGRCGVNDPLDIDAFEASGGFSGLRKVLGALSPDDVIEEIVSSGLSGRGGAAFPTGLKWRFTAQAEGETHYLVCNGDESEPGTFKDRVLMEGDPFQVLEGMLIAGYAIGARKGYIYVRGEYYRAREILQKAIEIAHQRGFLGENILDSGFAFDIELRAGAGAYVCGEETALFESIEGKRGYPRLKPPYPTTEGLFGQPTAINNVETLCSASWIMAHGADAYRTLGTEKSPGTKLFCLSGDVRHPGVYEAPFGTTMRELIDMAGGVVGDLQAVLVGGAAGSFATPQQIDVPMSFEGLSGTGLSLGSGVINVINTDRDLRNILVDLAHFFAHESCGKCFPCQLGTQRQLEIVSRIAQGTSKPTDIQALKDVIFTMTNTSFCGLGMTAGTAIESALAQFPDMFDVS